MVLAVLSLLCAASAAAAHHSFVVEYDIKRPLMLTGVVSKVEWANPHALLLIDVADKGGTTTWTFQLASPNVLERNGWTRRTLRAGHRVAVRGYGGFAIATRGVVSSVTMPDGRVLAAGPGPEYLSHLPGSGEEEPNDLNTPE